MLNVAARRPLTPLLGISTSKGRLRSDRDFSWVHKVGGTRLHVLVFLMLSLLAGRTAIASSFVHASVSRSAGAPVCFQTTTTPNQGVGTGCQIAGSSGFAPVLGVASAHADGIGLLRTSARLSSGDSDGGSWRAIGFAQGADTLRITSPGLAGTQGIADIFFSAHTADTRDGASLLSGTLGVITELQVTDDGRNRLTHSVSFPRTLPPFFARVFFVYGDAFELGVSLESKVTCTLCTGSWNGIADASNTATLDIIEVQGLDSSQFMVQSLLGNRYANVVPEPSTALLLGLGLAALGRRGRPSGSPVGPPRSDSRRGS